jgi:hypothetical protein
MNWSCGLCRGDKICIKNSGEKTPKEVPTCKTNKGMGGLYYDGSYRNVF